VTVTLEVFVPSRVTEVGFAVQETVCGAPKQVRFTCWLKPLIGLTLTVYVADWPAVTVAVLGATSKLKSGIIT